MISMGCGYVMISIDVFCNGLVRVFVLRKEEAFLANCSVGIDAVILDIDYLYGNVYMEAHTFGECSTHL